MARSRIPLPFNDRLAAVPPPTNSCYWVTPHLLAGALPRQPDIDSLLNAGVRHFVNLLESDETDYTGKKLESYEELVVSNSASEATCVRFPIKDLGTPTLRKMHLILDSIDMAIASGRIVFIHCWAGVGRTGTVIACWLIRHHYASTATVFHELQRLRQHDQSHGYRDSPQTSEQIDFVKNWI